MFKTKHLISSYLFEDLRWLVGLFLVLTTNYIPHSYAADAALLDAYNRNGFALFEEMAAPGRNFVFSPLGLGSVMSMARLGAKGDTEHEMQSVLSPTISHGDITKEYRILQSLLETQANWGDAKLQTANALHLTKFGDLVSQSYKSLLADGFDAEIFSGSDLAAINRWVNDKTDGKIERILEKLDPLSVCVLLNAVSFSAQWQNKFQAAKTTDGDFHLRGGGIITNKFMQTDGNFRVIRAQSFDIIELPYKNNAFSMLIVLPSGASGSYPLETGLTFEQLETFTSDLSEVAPETLRLRMPKFRISSQLDMIAAYQALGVRLAFDPDRADFTGITQSVDERDRIHITQIKHSAVLEVDEEGTEAATASAVEFGLRSARPPGRRFDIDRPFLFYVLENSSSAVLFMGRVENPAE